MSLKRTVVSLFAKMRPRKCHIPRFFSFLFLFLVNDQIVRGLKSVHYESTENRLNKLLSFEEEYKLFEEELENGVAKGPGKSRQKRYVFLNTESAVNVGFLVVIPVTVIIPSMTNLFNVWRRKRSIQQDSFYNITLEGDSYLQSQADRVSAYFDMIHIPEKSCQLRAVCEFSADPGRYFPLSDIILSKITDERPEYGHNNYQFSRRRNAPVSSFDLYKQSYEDGSTFGEKKCAELYDKVCKYSMDKLLNMPVLKFWNKLQSNLQLKFEDASEFT